MIKFEVVDKKLIDIKNKDAYVIFVTSDFDIQKLSKNFSNFFPSLKDLAEKRKFKGSAGTHLAVSCSIEEKSCYLLIYGLGNSSNLDIEKYRKALGQIIRFSEHAKIDSLALEMPQAKLYSRDIENLAQETASIMQMANYHFDDFISDKERKLSRDLKVTIATTHEHIAQVKSGLNNGVIIGDAVNKARYWCDLPAGNAWPAKLADEYVNFNKKLGIKYTVFDEKEIIKHGMGGIEGVCRGSDHEPRFVIGEYKTKPSNKTLVIVGKGVTFDSGGLSIKPANSMETMKDDMAGSAVVHAVMNVIGHLKPKNINVIAISPLVENMPSGKAIRPGDVLKFYNGKTAEVKNTDAEGRLILADALSYAVKNYNPTYMIDLATLTGACSAALGPIFAGLFGEHENVLKMVEKSASFTGDKVWRLPVHDDYKLAIKSEIADMSNIGSQRYMAGATTAAYFLQNFVEDTPWAHIDIAGVAFDVPDTGYFRSGGATAYGVRLLVDLIMNLNGK